MKYFRILLTLLVVLTAVGLDSCGKKSGNSPVDQYVGLLDAATEKAQDINSFEDLVNVQQIISPKEARDIIMENQDYELTDKDKKRLKKSYDKLLRVAYDKTTEVGGLSESMKKDTKKQIDMVIDITNKNIDNATTMGDLLGL